MGAFTTYRFVVAGIAALAFCVCTTLESDASESLSSQNPSASLNANPLPEICSTYSESEIKSDPDLTRLCEVEADARQTADPHAKREQKVKKAALPARRSPAENQRAYLAAQRAKTRIAEARDQALLVRWKALYRNARLSYSEDESDALGEHARLPRLAGLQLAIARIQGTSKFGTIHRPHSALTLTAFMMNRIRS